MPLFRRAAHPRALILLLLTLCAWAHAWAAQVETFSPQGSVKGVRQVAVRFSEAMVAFGDPQQADPFDIDCPVDGTGRWADHRNWVYDFPNDLPGGVHCTFSLREAVRTRSGDPVDPAQFSFSTGGPAIVESLPGERSQIEEEQAFVLVLDAPVDPASVIEHAWCDADGIEERIGVRLIEGEDRARILDSQRFFVDRLLQARARAGELRDLAGAGKDAAALRAAATERLPLLVLRCARRLPAESVMRLVWGEGIRSRSGVATDAIQALEYTVRPPFTATFSCQRAARDGGCLPFLPMSLGLSAPIARALAQKVVLRGPDRSYPSRLPDENNGGEWVTSVEFEGPFPENAQFRLELPGDVRDDAGRRLANQSRFPLAVSTDAAPPLAKFPARFGIVEAKPAGVLPVTLRNVERKVRGRVLRFGDGKSIPGGVLRLRDANARTIVRWMRAVDDHQDAEWLEGKEGEPGGRIFAAERSILDKAPGVRRIDVPKQAGARAFEVVGIPLRQPGFYVVELASPKLGAALLTGSHPEAKGGEVYHVSTAALVTNLAVHFKQGRESSLVWVTALDSGRPVSGARVSVQDCGGKEYWKGVTDANGIARSSAVLPSRDALPGCMSDWDRQLMALAAHGADLGFVMSDWNEGIARWRFNLPGPSYEGPYIASTVFDRTLVRAGETVHMKHLVRQQVGSGLRNVDASRLPASLRIEHAGSDEVYELPVRWQGGSAISEWQVPTDAKVGTYRVQIEDRLSGEPRRRPAGSFRVEEFRVPLMRASLEAPAGALVQVREVPVGVQVSYLAGGGAANAPVTLRGLVRPRTVRFEDHPEFTFLSGAVREGVQDTRRRDDWLRDELGLDDQADGEVPAGTGSRALATRAFSLDRAGGGRAALGEVPEHDTPQEVVAELEYRDPNGEILTAATRMPWWPAAVVLGIKADGWAQSGDKQVQLQALALDLAGRPLAGVPVAFNLFERRAFAHRKRLLGGFYAYESGAEIVRVGTVCEGTSDDKGRVACRFESPVSGEVLVEASTADVQGRRAATSASVWVAGQGEWWFDASDDDRMDLIPERKRYEPGERARLQVRMPYRSATALVTVEREGVLDAFVARLSGKSPVVEVPLKGHHAPNVFVSVLAVRGRVSGVQPTALVDLGKPAFRMGLAELKVGWRAFELNVDVRTDRQDYRPREKAKVAVHVTRVVGGAALPKGSEVALVAVDEGLLELAPNGSWDLLSRMMQRRGLEVDTATASMQVVGKRHYGRKARAAGGGGGRQTARELFDTLLYWQARVKLDAQGRGTAEIPLNDSLTSFRIVAVANAGSSLFGSGHATIRSTRELMLFSGLPPLVREQDDFRALFTVRNASERALDVDATARVVPDRGKAQTLPAQRVRLEPGASAEVSWRYRVPAAATRARWEVSAQAAPGEGVSVQDALSISQQVLPAVPVRTVQATLAQVDRTLEIPVAMPAAALPGRGGIQADLQARLGGELPGVQAYMQAYPYTCLEQLASRALALRDLPQWEALMAGLPSYLDRDGLAKYFGVMREGSDTLTTYLLSIADEAGWIIPDSARTRMLAGLERFVAGQLVREAGWNAADLSLRKIAALQALARWGRPAQDNDLASVSVDPELWPTSTLLDWIDLLKRSPQLSGRDARLLEASNLLRARVNLQGSIMTFSTERQDALWWLMVSGDANANRMLLVALDLPAWHEDLGRLVRGALGRQQRGHWDTTVANAWGVIALEKFGRTVESVPVSGATRIAIGGQAREHHWAQAPSASLSLPWPDGKASLRVVHDGVGKPWASVRSLAAVPLDKAQSSGYRIVRSVVPIEQKEAGRWSRGDVLRVRLELEAQSDMSWVVVNDPVPAGASVLGTGLGRDPLIATQGERREGWVWPAFEERKLDSFRAYYRFVPKGAWTLEYTLRLNNPGEFSLPPTRVEALYAPEMFGELPLAKLVVAP